MSFRKIDIDALDPENVSAVDEFIPISNLTLADISQRSQTAKQLLSKGDYAGVLSFILQDPPYGASEDIKTQNLKNVVEVLNSIRNSQVTELVNGLSQEEQSVLVKYLYRGMEAVSSSSLLTWFEKTVDVGGQGVIIKYMTDRRTV